ncbi:MAG: PBP1A family penicillin-binding protein [Nitrospirota bacterium]
MKGKIGSIIIIIISVILLSGAGTFYILTSDLPGVGFLKNQQIPGGTKVYSDDEQLIGEFRIEKGIPVRLKDIDKDLVNAVLAIEDSRFYRHKGLDHIAIARALLKDIISIEIKEGGSTITQQLAKVLFLTPERSLQRKIKEAVLALRIEGSLSKDQILELYLNKIYFGHGAYGVEMASRTYFGKSVGRLSLAESAMLAGLIRAPNVYSPYNDLSKARYRQLTVLKRMKEEGLIKSQDVEKAWKQPIYLLSLREKVNNAPYFLEYIRQYLEGKYGTEMVYKGGLNVYTTLNREMQAIAVRSLQEGLRELDKRQGYRGPIARKEIDPTKTKVSDEEDIFKPVMMTEGDIFNGTVVKVIPEYAVVKARGLTGKIRTEDMLWAGRRAEGGTVREIKSPKTTDILKVGDVVKVRLKSVKGKSRDVSFALEQDPLVEGAIIAMEAPTGFIKVMVGGYNYQRSEFNRAVQANRQAGSAFKPIVFASALDNGFTPASVVVDEPVTYDETLLKPGWSPENYDGKYYGPTRLRTALIYSRNVVTVRLLEMIGIKSVIELATRLGIRRDLPYDLTLGLGSLSVSPLELTSAYSAFANGGLKMEPQAVRYITDSKGYLLESNEPQGEQVISPQTAFLMTSMMEDVVKQGTGWRAKALGRPVAGKTGTTNDYIDAWFIGYTPRLVTGVWVGFDNRQSLGKQETGARAASPIWVKFMDRVMKDRAVEDFSIPPDIVMTEIDAETGLLPVTEISTEIGSIPVKWGGEVITEFFKKGTAPTEYAPPVEERPRVAEPKKTEKKPSSLDID